MRCRRPGRHADLAGDSGAGRDALAVEMLKVEIGVGPGAGVAPPGGA